LVLFKQLTSKHWLLGTNLGLTRFNTVWPKLNFDSQTQAALRGYWFLADFDDGNIFGIRSTIYWSIEHVGLGVSSRILFQNQLNRLDVGPAVKIGYKFIWLEYSWDFLSDNNVFKDEDLPVIGFKNQEHNVNLTLSIPIVKRKE